MKNRHDIASLILRLSLGGMMLLHGISKLTNGIGGIEKKFDSVGLPSFLAYAVFIGEVIAPIMMIIGYRTRLAAILYAFTMVVAVWLAHAEDVFALSKGGAWAIELQALFFFGAVVLALKGGGKYALSKRSKWD
ncbi:DoxX family protein [bacterium]|nr:DoxX family protein [bacterium]